MMSESDYQRYLSALLAGDRQQCTEVVFHLLKKNLDTEIIYTDLLQRSLYRIGELWAENRISVAAEHLATAVTENILATLYPYILSNRNSLGRKAVISCSVNEYHQVGARMVADIMEAHGWDASFLGANTPAEDMLELLEEKKPEILGLSVSIYFNMSSLLKMIEKIHTHFPQLDIIVGGQAFYWGGKDLVKDLSHVTYIPSLQSLIQTICPEKTQ